MALLSRVRRWFAPETPVEIEVASPPREEVVEPAALAVETPEASADAPTPIDLLDRIEHRLDEGREAQDRVVKALAGVPGAMSELTRLSGRQDDLLAAIRELGDAQRSRSESETAVLERLGDLIDRESALFGLVQRQLDANHEIVAHTAVRLEQLAEAVTEASRTNRTTGEAMEAMVGELRDQERRQDERAGAMQGWIVTCVVACIGATAAALALAWAVLGQTNG